MKRMAFILIIFISLSMAGCRQRRDTRTLSYGKTYEISEQTLQSGNPDTLNMGTMREGEKVTLEFLLKNATGKPFAIERVASGCGCALFGYARKPVSPGESAAMEVTFNSAGFYGEVIKEAKIYTSASEEPYRIIIEAAVK